MDETALSDLQDLATQIDQLVAATEPEAIAQLAMQVERNLKAIALLHFDYHREVFQGYDAHLARNGLKATLAPCT